MKGEKVRKTVALAVAVVFLITLAGVFAAAEGENDFTARGTGYTSVLYDSASGLPTSEANVVLQTSDGFLWIGSYAGLIRYDGGEFYRFDASLGISSVVSLFEDSKRRLWIGTNDNGAAFYKDGEFKFYSKTDGLRSSSIRSVAEDSDGNIIIATTIGIAYVDENDELHVFDDPQINEEYVCELRCGSDGVIYGETLSGGFFSIEDMRITSFYNGNNIGLGAVNCIAPDLNNNGYVYIGTENSEIYYANMAGGMKEFKMLSTAPHATINHIEQFEDKIWVCADNGIGYIDKDFTAYTAISDASMNNSIDDMTVDHEGNLWFASSRQGVMKIVPCRFTNISEIAGLGDMVVNSTCLYGGDLYIGTDNGLVILDGESYAVKQTPLTEKIGDARIRSIKTDSKGNLWLCTFSTLGLVCYSGDGTITTYTEENGLASNRARTLAELSDGSVAVSASGGLHIIRDGVITDTYNNSSGGLSNTEFLTICEGENGKIYLGSDGDGVYIVDGHKVTRLGLEDGLRSEVILRIKKDETSGLYWIITSNSIAYMQDEKITTVTNFPYSNNFDMYFDSNGGAWILSSNGIYMTSTEQLIEDEDIEYILYDTACGLPSVATANSRSCVDDNGNLYISGATGVSSININEEQNSQSDIRLTVPYVEADDRLISAGENGEIVIPSSCKRLTIYDYAFTYSLSDPKISYYLEGFDDERQYLLKQDMQPVLYTNLNGGEYTFHMSVVNTLTGEDENTFTIKIVKRKAFYERVWFWVLSALLLGLIIFLGVREYMRRKTAALVERERQKEAFIDQVVQAFAKCIDMKDTYTRGHSFRVAHYTKLLAERLGYSEDKVKEIYNMALLHDIGKISIPDDILNKPGKPTDEEYAVLKTHSEKGREILKDIEIMPDVALGAGYHHERLDGLGYPEGLTGDQIPFIAQIIAVADTFDAMYSTRPYRKQMDIKDVEAEMKRVAGTQLNAEIVDILADLIDEGIIGNEKL